MSITDELNEKKTLDFSEYSYVCASTLNQMVNYIPLVMDEFKFKDFYTVTLYRATNLTTKVKENAKWDENLQETLDKNIITFNEIKIEQNEFLKVSKTIEAFDKVLKDKKIFWNLTGGQRPFVLAVLEYVKDKPEHYIAYLEGNTGQISIKSTSEEILIPYSLPKGTKNLIRFISFLIILIIVINFLPWTQNVRSKGTLISLYPQQRPQMIQTVIPGGIEKWYVSEGQLVSKGDTILKISEVKDDYFDPNLINNTQSQVEAKEYSKRSYDQKVTALTDQMAALEKSNKLNLQQAKNKVRQLLLKVKTDSMDMIAAKLCQF